MKNAHLVVAACELCRQPFRRTASVFKQTGVHDVERILSLTHDADLDGGAARIIEACLTAVCLLQRSYKAKPVLLHDTLKLKDQTSLRLMCKETLESLLAEATNHVRLDATMHEQARAIHTEVARLTSDQAHGINCGPL